jgi:chemotaxis signal transduction protein
MCKSSEPRTNNEIIEDFISEIGHDGIDNDIVRELIMGLGLKFPDSVIIKKLNETLEIELERERAESEFPWILFSLNGTAYSINSKYVLSIEILGTITPIVDAGHYSPGITESRGEMIELVDMLALFGSGTYLSGKSGDDVVSMMIVTEIRGIKRGIIVDEIIAVEHITRFDDNVMGDREGSLTSQYVGKIARRDKTDEPVLILNMDCLGSL